MRRAALLILTAALIFGVLVLPNHPGTMRFAALAKFPLELPAILLGLLALGRKKGVPALLALILLATVVLKLADYAMFTAYNRPFNPILDAFLIDAGFNLLSNSIGMPLTLLAVLGACIAAIVLYLAIWRALRLWSRLHASGVLRAVAGIVALCFVSMTVVDAGHALKYWKLEKSPPGTSWTTRLSFKRAVELRTTTQDLIAFRSEARQDVYAGTTGLFDLLGERDVLFIFIESYGRTSFENPLYRPTHRTTLRKAQRPLKAAGFELRSGWLTSPTSGGQSWLAHGALASGLWTSDNGRYNAMLTSGRKTLFHLAQESGYRTSTVMPAITLPWPESDLMGFETVLAAKDIPYRGARYNWITMPDQFTLATYPRLLSDDPRPEFMQIALISSHAPWVPIPPVIDWSEVGDGTIFSQWAEQGPSPKEVWKDRDMIREKYRIAVDYALQVTLEHIVSLGSDAPLVVMLGDHQPVGFVAQGGGDDVPVHIMGPPEVMERLRHWNWTEGLIPAPDLAAIRMDGFRNLFIETFTSRKLADGDAHP